MSRRRFLILLIFVFILLVNINVKAEEVTCTGFKWKEGSCSDTIEEGAVTAGTKPTCDTEGTSYSRVTNFACPGTNTVCHCTKTWTKVTPNNCCCKGVTTSTYSCDTSKCTKASCIDHKLAFQEKFLKISDGSSLTYALKNIPDDAENKTWTLSENSSYLSLSGKSITATNKSGKCQYATITGSKDGDKKYNYKDVSYEIKIFPAWHDEGVKKMPNLTNNCVDSYELTQEEADEAGSDEYRIECQKSNDTCKCHVFTRGCGEKTLPSPHCYIDNKGFMRYGVYTYTKRACTKGSNKNKIVVCSGASDEQEVAQSKCNNEPKCDTENPERDDKLTPCNGQGYNSGDYKRYCGVPNVFNSSGVAETKYFNEINCHEDIYLKFDGPVTDYEMEESNNAYLFPATGFKYMLKATSRLKCKGDFYKTFYDDYINYLKKYAVELANLGTNDATLEAAMLKTTLEKFVYLVVNGYLEWDPNYNFDANVELTDLVAKEQGETPYTVTLVKNKATENIEENTWVCGKLLKQLNPLIKIKSDYSIDYGSRGHANFEYEQKQYFEKIVPRACLNEKTGKVTYGEPCSDDLFLGSQFFISSNRDNVNKPDYNYTVVVNDMGFTDASERYATNGTTGRLYVLDNKIIYRHVDPRDAFLQQASPGRFIGLNWLNKRYNFTGIVKPTNWTKDNIKYNTIRLDEATNMAIKRLTRGNNASVYYVRKCNNNESTICQLVNNARR